MSRIRSAATFDRRTFLTATGAVGAATGLGLAFGIGPDRPAQAATVTSGPAPAAPVPVDAPAVPRTPYTRGTTLAGVSAPRGSGGYRRLADGPAWDRVVRADLATAHGGRAERRTALASFVQFTDLHLVDVQSPLRYEYLRAETASAWRPQEALSVAGVVSLIERVNALPGGPATGAPLSFVMTTGDNTDNNSKLELEWFLTAMSGGRITPNSGDPRRYEGVQDSGLKLYWQPDSALRDADKQQGFPRLDGFLEAAIRTVHSPGLRLPWYSTVGNHDSLPGGCYAARRPLLDRDRHRRPQAGDAARRRGREGLEGGQGRPRPQGRGLQAAADLTHQAVQEGHPRRAARPLHAGPSICAPTSTRRTPAPARTATATPPRISTGTASTTPSGSPTTSSGSAWTPPTPAATTPARSVTPNCAGWSGR